MKKIILLAAAAALLFTLSAVQPAAAQSKPGLSRLLEAELSRFAGPGGPYHAGLYVKNMATGEVAGAHADEQFESASTIKMVILVMAYQMVDQKKLNLSERYTIKPSDLRGGSGVFKFNDPGLSPTLRDVITQMVITSDNSATDIMLASQPSNEELKAMSRQ